MTDTTESAPAHRIAPDDLGLALIRLILGVVFAFHGAQKLFGWFGGFGIDGTAQFFSGIGLPLPTLSAYLAGGVELFGGLLVMAGLLTRTSAAATAFTMFVASFTAHSGFATANNGMEFPLTLALVSVALVLTGPGRLTVASLALARDRQQAISRATV